MRNLRAAFFVIVAMGLGCSDGPSTGNRAEAYATVVDSMTAVLSHDREIEIDESGGKVLVSPRVYWEADGFLVADAEESRIFRFGPGGALEWTSGEKGSGPAEYRSAVGVLRLPSGEVLAADWNYKFVYLTASGDSATRTVETPFYHLEALELVDDSTLLVTSAMIDTADVGMAHLWSLSGDSVRTTFFLPADPTSMVTQVAGWTVGDVRGDTIALAFSTQDTVFLYDTRGLPLGSVPLQSEHFRRVEPPPEEARSDPRARMNWVSSFDLVTGVHLLSDRRLLVTYRSMTSPGQSHHYVMLDAEGRPAWELRDQPRLLAVSRSDELLLVHPDAIVPNLWLVAVP